MIVIPRVEITPAMVTTTAVDEPAWAPGTTYPLDALVSKGGMRWVSAQAGNVGHDPEEIASAWWTEDGPVNGMRMFDVSAETATTFVGDGVVDLVPLTHCTAMMLNAVVGMSVRLRVYRGAELTFDSTRGILSSDGTEWGYYFGETQRVGDVVFADIPVPATRYELTVSGGTQTSIGLCLMGRQVWIGDARKGASLGIELRGRDYVDAKGNPMATERGYSRSLSATLVMPRKDFGRVGLLLESLVQQPAGWVVAPTVGDYDAAALVGRFQRAVRTLDVDDANFVGLALEISGYR